MADEERSEQFAYRGGTLEPLAAQPETVNVSDHESPYNHDAITETVAAAQYPSAPAPLDDDRLAKIEKALAYVLRCLDAHQLHLQKGQHGDQKENSNAEKGS